MRLHSSKLTNFVHVLKTLNMPASLTFYTCSSSSLTEIKGGFRIKINANLKVIQKLLQVSNVVCTTSTGLKAVRSISFARNIEDLKNGTTLYSTAYCMHNINWSKISWKHQLWKEASKI
jgi:hypothetical protein